MGGCTARGPKPRRKTAFRKTALRGTIAPSMYHDFRELWTEELWDRSFGTSSISVYESKADLYDWQRWEKPYVVVWLHGMHQGPIDASTLRKLQRRLWRRVIFVVPTNPEPQRGMLFSWGCTFTKAQNKQVGVPGCLSSG